MNNGLRKFAATLLLVSAALLAGPSPAADGPGPYKLQKTISIGGQGNGWDYMSVDEVARRLYVTHSSSVAVVDIDKDVLIGVITNVPGAHAAMAVPKLERGFISVGRQNKVALFDLKSLVISGEIQTGPNPNAMVYEPDRQELSVFNGRGQSATVIDAPTAKVLTTINLGGQPAFAVLDPAAGRILTDLIDKHEIAVIDLKTNQVLDRWPVSPGKFPSSIAIDPAHHRLFVGCLNNLLLMLESTTGKVVCSVPIGARVDASAFDPATQLAFASCGDGTLTIAHEDSPEKLTFVQMLATEKGARTMALDTKTHRIFVAAARFTPPTEPVAGVPAQGPKLIPDSFGVMVYELQR